MRPKWCSLVKITSPMISSSLVSINDHANIVPSICNGTGWTLYDGMRYGVTVEEIVAGSSAEKVLISMTSEEAPTSNGKYWQLIFNDIVSNGIPNRSTSIR